MKTKKKPEAEFPRVLNLKHSDIQPTLVDAFRRWRDAGELHPSAILCEFVGSDDGRTEKHYFNVETGKRMDPSDLETVSYIDAVASTKKKFMIFQNAT